MVSIERLDKIIAKFWKGKRNSDIYYLGRCADFSYALKKYLGAGDIYTVGGMPPDIAWHTVLKYGPYYWDVRGKMTADEVISRTPIALSKSTILKAGPEEMKHIINLLNHNFVNDTIRGLKQAENEVK